MTFRISWGGRTDGGEHTVHTADELDAALDQIAVPPGGMPYSVAIFDLGESSYPLLEIGVGHSERSWAFHVAQDGDAAWGYQPEVEPMPGIIFDYAGQATEAWPERARLTPEAARAAAREFVASGGKRPASLSWDTDE